jgi:hypothetical protein
MQREEIRSTDIFAKQDERPHEKPQCRWKYNIKAAECSG